MKGGVTKNNPHQVKAQNLRILILYQVIKVAIAEPKACTQEQPATFLVRLLIRNERPCKMTYLCSISKKTKMKLQGILWL